MDITYQINFNISALENLKNEREKYGRNWKHAILWQNFNDGVNDDNEGSLDFKKQMIFCKVSRSGDGSFAY